MLRLLTDLVTRRRRWVLAVCGVLVPLLALVSAGIEDRLSVGGFEAPGVESTVVADVLEQQFDSGPFNYLYVVEAREGWVYSEDNARAGRELTDRVAAVDGVGEALSVWTLGEFFPPEISPLQSFTGTYGIVAMTLEGDEDDQRHTAERLDELTGTTENFVVRATGLVEISRQAAEESKTDLRNAELIAAPITLLALLFVFRGFRTALLPLAVAAFAVLGTFAVLTAITAFTTVSVFALNLTTALGLGLAVDYCLLMVARYREELARGRSVEIAVAHTVQTAGRTVLFSGATVASSLLALLVFPVPYLRSFAYAGIAVVAVACLASAVLLPALLCWLGDRVKARRSDLRAGFWGGQAGRVLRRPLLWALLAGGILVVVGLPFLRVEAGRIDDRVLPEDNPARHAATVLREEFTFANLNPIDVVALGADASDEEAVWEYQKELAALPGVRGVDSSLGRMTAGTISRQLDYHQRFSSDAGAWYRVMTFADPDTDDAEHVVDAIRALGTPWGPVIVGGPTATVADTVDSVIGRLPVALLVVAAVTVVVLFMMTGSVVVPVKAVLLNLLSLTATFGALVWIFQDGNLAGTLEFTPTGRIDVFTPVLMFCVAFGLSMDYEVFLLSRIKEEYDLSGDNRHAIVTGIGKTGRIVTAAAVLLTIQFVAIATSGVLIPTMIGAGLALAVLVDAFVVRATLTPALMAMAGRANWWAPSALRRFHLRWGIWEREPITLPDAAPANTTGDSRREPAGRTEQTPDPALRKTANLKLR